MCLYPEEMAIATMLHKFSNVDHHNENIWATGKDGEYKLQEPMENVELDAIKESTYFAALAHSEDNLQVYEDYFDAYTCES